MKAYLIFDYRSECWIAFDSITNEELNDGSDFDAVCRELEDYGYRHFQSIEKPVLVAKD